MELEKRYTITLDDDPLVHRLIGRMTGLPSLPFNCPEKLLGRASSYEPAAVFIDVYLELGISGLDFITKMRETWPYTPLLVVTDDPTGKTVGQALAAGANDVIYKPFVPEDLCGRMIARVNEMNIYRSRSEMQVYDVVFDRARGAVRKGERTVYLARLEADLLSALAENRGMLVGKQLLKRRFWGKISVSDNALDKKISNLRHSLKEIGAQFSIKSVYRGGVGLISHENGPNAVETL